jgi:hypothetical protein
MALTTRRQLVQQTVFFTVIAFALFLVLPVGARGQDNSAAENPRWRKIRALHLRNAGRGGSARSGDARR